MSTIDESKFIVVIVGYEGIQIVFGPFNEIDGVCLTSFLKMEAPKQTKNLTDDELTASFAKADRLAKQLNVAYIPIFSSEQVCLQVSTEAKTYECACNLLPIALRNKEQWFY